MGKRQRHSEFTGVSPDELKRISKDLSETSEKRMKALTELKFRKLRNIQKRSK